MIINILLVMLVSVWVFSKPVLGDSYNFGDYTRQQQQLQHYQQQQQMQQQLEIQRQQDFANETQRNYEQMQRNVDKLLKPSEPRNYNFKHDDKPTYINELPSDTDHKDNPRPVVYPSTNAIITDIKTHKSENDVKKNIRIDEIKSKIKQNPIDQNMHIALGDMYLEFYDTEHAIDTYKIACSLEPKNNYTVYNKLARAYVMKIRKDHPHWVLKDMGQVLDAANRAISINDKNTESYVVISEGYLEFRYYDSAIKYLNKALAINSSDKYANYYLGIAFNCLKDKDKAFLQYMILRQIEIGLNIKDSNESLSNKLFNEIYK